MKTFYLSSISLRLSFRIIFWAMWLGSALGNTKCNVTHGDCTQKISPSNKFVIIIGACVFT